MDAGWVANSRFVEVTATKRGRRGDSLADLDSITVVDCDNHTATTMRLVSNTARTLLVTQGRLQNLWREAASLGWPTNFIHNRLDRFARRSRKFLQAKTQQKLHLLLLAGRSLGKGSGRGGVHFNGYVRSCHGVFHLIPWRTQGLSQNQLQAALPKTLLIRLLPLWENSAFGMESNPRRKRKSPPT